MFIPLIARVIQLVFAAIVLALSAILIKGYGPGHNPSIIDYGAFCGGAAVLISAVGITSLFLEPLQGIVTLGLDAFASFFLLAGGLAFAIQTKVGSCTDETYLELHYKTFCPSSTKNYGYDTGDKWQKDFLNDTENRCRLVQADTAFVWFTFALFAVTLATAFLGGRRRGAAGTFV